jgi:hypothetical protein
MDLGKEKSIIKSSRHGTHNPAHGAFLFCADAPLSFWDQREYNAI